MLAESNAQDIKKRVEQASATKLIVDGIRESIAFHTNNGTHLTASETCVKNITHVYLFKIVKEKESVSHREISSITGVRRDHVSLMAKIVDDLLMANSPVSVKALVWKSGKDYIRLKLQPYVFDFLFDDNCTWLRHQIKVDWNN